MDPKDAKDFLAVHAQKGVTAKELREAMLRVFHKLGGETFLQAWAQKSPKNMETFFKLLVQLMPKEHKLGGDPENPLRLAAANPIDPEKYRLKAATATCVNALAAPVVDAETEEGEE